MSKLKVDILGLYNSTEDLNKSESLVTADGEIIDKPTLQSAQKFIGKIDDFIKKFKFSITDRQSAEQFISYEEADKIFKEINNHIYPVHRELVAISKEIRDRQAIDFIDLPRYKELKDIYVLYFALGKRLVTAFNLINDETADKIVLTKGEKSLYLTVKEGMERLLNTIVTHTGETITTIDYCLAGQLR